MKNSPEKSAYGDRRSESDVQLVTFSVADQLFGIPALKVRDVLRQQPLTRVPMALPHVRGAINLRGHIVVAIDVRAKLGCSPALSGESAMCVVVETNADVVCLLVDSVGDVVEVAGDQIEENPGSLDVAWARLSRGVCRMGDRLLLLLDVEELLT